jgi:hypothetical protein
MDKAALVSVDIERGLEIMRALDAANLKVNVVAWFQLPEYVDPRLVLASRTFDSVELGEDYGLVHKALKAAGFPVEHTPALLILPMKDPLIRDLRRIFRKAKSVLGMRLGGQTIGDRFIEDGYVYRVL